MHMPIKDCLDGHLYKLDARNASCGIYDAGKKAFELHRYKFGNTFLDYETHWDADEKHGTAKPLLLVEEAPELSDYDRLDYLYAWSDMLQSE